MAYKNGVKKRHLPIAECDEYYRMFISCGSTSPECEGLRQQYLRCLSKGRPGPSAPMFLGGNGATVYAVKGVGGSSIPWIKILVAGGCFVAGVLLARRTS